MDYDKLGQIIIMILIPTLTAVSTFIAAWFKAKTDEIEKKKGTK